MQRHVGFFGTRNGRSTKNEWNGDGNYSQARKRISPSEQSSEKDCRTWNFKNSLSRLRLTNACSIMNKWEASPKLGYALISRRIFSYLQASLGTEWRNQVEVLAGESSCLSGTPIYRQRDPVYELVILKPWSVK